MLDRTLSLIEFEYSFETYQAVKCNLQVTDLVLRGPPDIGLDASSEKACPSSKPCEVVLGGRC